MSACGHTYRRRLAALVGVALLSGCNPVDSVRQGVEDAIESASGADVNLGSLPDDFPESVPLIEGQIGLGAGGADSGDAGWVVTVTSSAEDPLGDAAAALEAAGFTEDSSVSGGTLEALKFSDADYIVGISVIGDTVTYAVSAK